MFVDTSIKGSNYQLAKSLRLRAAASGYLARTFPVAGNRQKWTLSFWMKRGTLGSTSQPIISTAITAGSTEDYIGVNNDQLVLNDGAAGVMMSTAAVFRDPAAWYHVVVVYDSANAVAANRGMIYVNGVRQTLNVSNIALNRQSYLNAAAAHAIGRFASIAGYFFDGYLAEINFVDGQALTPYAFGQKNADSGAWEAVRYTGGAYGTNGFYLPFSDGSSLSALCADKSGNGNNWTSSGVSLTAGATYDWMSDSPTNNYCVLNPLDTVSTTATAADGNLASTTGAAGNLGKRATMVLPSSGKWFWEVTPSAGTEWYIGLSKADAYADGIIGNTTGGQTSGLSYAGTTGQKMNGTLAAYAATYTIGDVIGVAADMDLGTLTFYKNGVSLGVAFSGINMSQWLPAFSDGSAAGSSSAVFNFGQRPFAYAVPAGHAHLCTASLPTPAVARGEAYFKARTYLGNGGGLQIGEIQKAIDLVSINQSLRFSSADTSYLSRTPAAAGDRTRWTWSGWVRRTTVGGTYTLFGSSTAAYDELRLSGDTLRFFINGAASADLVTTQLFRDPAAWIHVVLAVDTTQATASNRVKLYVNGQQITIFTTATYPALNTSCSINNNIAHAIGYSINNVALALDSYLTDVNFVDGQQLTAGSFGQWDANGYWVPANPSVSNYGTNGFRLTFSDSSAATAAALGKDSSGKGNNWVPNGFSVAAGVAMDVLADSPTNAYATLDPIRKDGTTTISDGNLLFTGGNYAGLSSLRMSSGKWYFEATVTVATSSMYVGITQAAPAYEGAIGNTNGGGAYSVSYYANGQKWVLGTNTAYGTAWGTVGDVIGTALDLDAGTVTFYRNGVSQGAISISTGIAWVFNITNATSTGAMAANFGQRPFAYTPPAGCVALCENNIAEYVNDLETPDLVWIKGRSAATQHMLFDRARGAGKYLVPNQTSAVGLTDANSLIQFNKNGFYLGNNANVNTKDASYAAWMWKKGATPGFDAVGYTKTNAAVQAVNHSLGVKPAMIIVKSIETSSENWHVWHKSLTDANYAIQLNGTAAQSSLPTVWNGVAPTSTQFTLGTTWAGPYEHVAYLFAEVPGFSKFGSYVGNGSADGPFLNLGFRPAFFMLKNMTRAGTRWIIIDAARDPSNKTVATLSPNFTNVELSGSYWFTDFLSNGVKLREYTGGDTEFNYPGDTFIYAAFAENPFKNANAR